MEKFISQHGVHRGLVFQITTEIEIQREKERDIITHRLITLQVQTNSVVNKQSCWFQQWLWCKRDRCKLNENMMFLALFNCAKTVHRRNEKIMSVSFTQQLPCMFMTKHTWRWVRCTVFGRLSGQLALHKSALVTLEQYYFALPSSS